MIRHEDSYSVFYKQQLRLCILDIFESFSGGVHKFCDHVSRTVAEAFRNEKIIDFRLSWIESPDVYHPFTGRNFRSFVAGKDSQYAIWCVLDVFLKVIEPVLAKGCHLERYLERAGLTLSEFVDPKQQMTETRLQGGIYSSSKNNEMLQSLAIQSLANRRFKLAHLINERVRDIAHTCDAADGTVLKDDNIRIDKGVLVPQPQGWLLLVRDLETAKVKIGFVQASNGGVELKLVKERDMHVCQLVKTNASPLQPIVQQLEFSMEGASQ